MPTAAELYRAGDLAAAVTAAAQQVKADPAARGPRLFLAELLLFAGELERADNHFDYLSTPDAADLVGLTLLRHLVRGETARREVFEKGRPPEFLAKPHDAPTLALDALTKLRAGDDAGAVEAIAKADTARKPVAGTHNGERFDGFRDLDDLTAGLFEVVTATGTYYWVPIETVERVEFSPPTRAWELVWRRAVMSVRDGPDGVVYVPCLYPGSHRHADPAVRLGRATDWTGTPVRGSGLREYLVGETAVPILELTTIEFDG